MTLHTNIKKAMRITAGSALLAALLPMTNALAALPPMPTSGTCAMLVTQPVPYGGAVPFGPTGYNITAAFTFTSASGGTAEFYGTNVTYTSSGIQSAVPSTSTPGSPIPFSLTASTIITGADVLTMNPGGGTISMNVTPVNGGKTLLVQGQDGALSGVCQF